MNIHSPLIWIVSDEAKCAVAADGRKMTIKMLLIIRIIMMKRNNVLAGGRKKKNA